ncbi:hypothetical protein TURU_133780 [Turdus rufiventris]|nr:hypothetical protein TURU_133780 [Turdus rufiventris]
MDPKKAPHPLQPPGVSVIIIVIHLLLDLLAFCPPMGAPSAEVDELMWTCLSWQPAQKVHLQKRKHLLICYKILSYGDADFSPVSLKADGFLLSAELQSLIQYHKEGQMMPTMSADIVSVDFSPAPINTLHFHAGLVAVC